MSRAFEPGDALLLVDVQRDFCPGGALAIERGDAVVPVLNRWINDAQSAGIPIYASRDWHPQGHISFKEQGGPWPSHCLAQSEGAAFHPALQLPAQAVVISKGTLVERDAYSAFDQTDLAERLRTQNVKRLWIGGLAQDVCVRATVLDALRLGFAVGLIAGGSQPVSEANGQQALREMLSAGAVLTESV